MADGPIQVVLNADHYQADRERPKGRGRESDFFAGQDAAFVAHREILKAQLDAVAHTIERDSYSKIGFAKVTLRRSKWAKSHRPTTVLFEPTKTPVVGGADLGQLIVELTPDRAQHVRAEMDRAEDETRLRLNDKTGHDEPAPSRRRAEISAIESIDLWRATDRRRFPLERALQWFADPRSGGAYLVELFERPPPEGDWDLLSDAKRALFRTFRDGLLEQGPGLVAEGRAYSPNGRAWLQIRLEDSQQPPRVQLDLLRPPIARLTTAVPQANLTPQRHGQLLAFVDQHPLVRRIRLQPTPVRTHAGGAPGAVTTLSLPESTPGASYPKVGVIDGGLGIPFTPWIMSVWNPLAAVHQDLSHGSFIAGLLVAGKSFNTDPGIQEPDGCELADVALLPSEDDPSAFSRYFPSGIPDFFDEVEAAVTQLRHQHGLRIYNFSINLHDQQADPDFYSAYAERLDGIADANDVLFVISAGNLNPGHLRAEWPVDPVAALRALAAARDDRMTVPAESIRNVSVNALNPHGVSGTVPHALANYSRRGPGLRTGVKPDLCHVGGAGQSIPATSTGLHSIDEHGASTSQCGTSYAAPLVARTLAGLNHAIEGDVSRETLLALTVHHAKRPPPFENAAITDLARELIGFGMPQPTETILRGHEDRITLVFAGRLQQDKQLTFAFSWPAVLTSAAGKCRGHARLTLVSHPPLDYKCGAELVRANVSAKLQQSQGNGRYKGQLHETYLPSTGDEHLYEAELIEQGFKWSPVKTYERLSERGIGNSSNWRLVVDALTRANEPYPPGGIPFSVILTITDPEGTQPVFDSMRQSLQSLGVQIADIRTAARVVARV
jgi:hypothetical protein